MKPDDTHLRAEAETLQGMIRGRGGLDRIHVRAGMGHLTVEAEDSEGARQLLARAVPAGAGTYLPAILVAPWRWKYIPPAASLEAVAGRLLGLVVLPRLHHDRRG